MKKFFALLFGLVFVILMIGGCENLEGIFPFSNNAPVIISKPIINAIEDELYSYQVEAIDSDGDDLNYSLMIKPEGMSIDSENGLISWAPINNQVGTHKVNVKISDGKQSVSQSFQIEVFNVNNPPQIISYFPASLNVEVNEGDSIKFEVQAQDIDLNTILSYQWLLNEKEASNSIGSGNDSKSSWIYFIDYGDYSQKIVKVLVSDGELENYIQWNIVTNDTTPPAQPTLDTVLSPTNITPQILSGSKESNSSIWINGTEVISISSDVAWSYAFDLFEGNNKISITSRDAFGNESTAATTDIVLDTIAPSAVTLNMVTSPTNISSQILSGTKDANSSILINSAEIISVDSSVNWSYSYNLTEGNNNIMVTSRDAAGNDSFAVITTIEYDTNIYVDAGNTAGTEDGTKTHPFNTITEGLIAVSSGKSVVVAAGIYNEQLIINKNIALRGESQDNTFITGSGLTGNLISLEADNITISGFTIDGASSTSIGIYFDNYSFININVNSIKNNKDYGISYIHSAPTIEDNNIENNSSSGIKVATNGAGMIRNNSIAFNQHGIRAYGDSRPEINRNNICNNNTGIYCRESATPIISYNTISNNSGYGILIDNTLGNSVNPDIGGGDGESDGQNKITGNNIHGVSNKTTHHIMALNNWWGNSAGPKYPGNPNNATIPSDWAYWNTTLGQGPIEFFPYLSVQP
jgi:parallel beta-helix repeat protein